MSKVIESICSCAPAAAGDSASEAAASEALDPESPVDNWKDGKHAQPGFLSGKRQQQGRWMVIGKEIAYRGGIQLVIFVLLFFVLWFRGMLPPHIQSKIDALRALVWQQEQHRHDRAVLVAGQQEM